jgi:hypothetical protein
MTSVSNTQCDKAHSAASKRPSWVNRCPWNNQTSRLTRMRVQLAPDVSQGLVEQIGRVVTSTSKSNIPSIYGMAAEAEVKRLRRTSSDAGDTDDQVEEARRPGCARLCCCRRPQSQPRRSSVHRPAQ